MSTLFTIGHSNRKWADFLTLLKQHRVSAIADVRSKPVSRFRHFNRDQLAVALKSEEIEYVFLGDELGARRIEAECYVDGVAIYENIAKTTSFQDGLNRLINGAKKYRLAMMCSEKEPLDCHRAILVCRHLRDCLSIQHIHSDGHLEPHQELERRLVELMRPGRSLFERDIPESEVLELAYEIRGRRIAYRTQD